MIPVVNPNAGDILKEYLFKHGIKQSFVAKQMKLSDTTFSARINGRLRFTAEFAIQVASVLGISPDIFFSKSYRKTVTK